MISREEIANLAKLARLEISEADMLTLEKEIPGMLAFVDTIQKVHVSAEAAPPELRNVMREDKDPYEGGKFTEMLLKAAPAREGNRVTVKQVISRKK